MNKVAGGPRWLVGTCGPLGGVSEVVGVSAPKEILQKPAEKVFSITIFGPPPGVSDSPPPARGCQLVPFTLKKRVVLSQPVLAVKKGDHRGKTRSFTLSRHYFCLP